MLPMTFILTCRVFVASAKIMRRADASVTAYVEVALVESTANSITALEIRTLLLIMIDSTKELMDEIFCTLATW